MAPIKHLVELAATADNVQVFHGFCAGNNLVSRAIQALDLTPFEGKWYAGRWSHTYWLFRFTLCTHCQDGDAGQKPDILELMYESHWKAGVEITPYQRLLEATDAGRVIEHVEYATHLPPERAWKLWRECLKIHGQPYDRARLLMFYSWVAYWRKKNPHALTTIPDLPWFIRGMNTKYICSELTEESGRLVGMDLCGQVSSPQTTSPNLQAFVIRGKPSILDTRD